MRPYARVLFFTLLLLCSYNVKSQTDTITVNKDSVNTEILKNYNKRIVEIEQQRVEDSIKKADLENQLNSLKTTDNIQKEELLLQLKTIEDNNKSRIANKIARIDSLRNTASGFPVITSLGDTLFHIYSKIGASTPQERALSISKKSKNWMMMIF